MSKHMTVRYIKFTFGGIYPEKIILIGADDDHPFDTDFPAVPPGEQPVPSAVGRWSRVIIHHDTSMGELAAYEGNYWKAPVTTLRMYSKADIVDVWSTPHIPTESCVKVADGWTYYSTERW